MGASQATELSPGGFTRRTPPAAGKPPSSGWLTSSDSISHGRFAPGTLLDGRYRIIGLLGRAGWARSIAPTICASANPSR